jgi:hypothetical protein
VKVKEDELMLMKPLILKQTRNEIDTSKIVLENTSRKAQEFGCSTWRLNNGQQLLRERRRVFQLSFRQPSVQLCLEKARNPKLSCGVRGMSPVWL